MSLFATARWVENQATKAHKRSMDNVTLRPFHADDAQWLVKQHDLLYARDEGFNESFGRLVAQILNDFLADYDPRRECGWIAEKNGLRLGSIFCVAQDDHSAKLRLFLLVPEARGQGIGRHLLDECMEFARTAGYREMVLWTHESHRAACALYRAFGWQLVDSKPVHSFGVDLVEQSWRIQL